MTDDPARVLLVASSNRRRGAEVFAENLRGHFEAHGWVVDAVSLTSSSGGVTSIHQPLIDIDTTELGRLSPRVLAALRRKIKEFAPQVLLASGGATLRYGALASIGLPVKLAYIGIGEPEYWLRSSLSRSINRWLLRRTDAIIAVSRMTASQLAVLEPAIADRVHYGPTGVPEGFFELDAVGGSGSALNVVMIGNLSKEKDPIAALRAVSLLPDVVLRVVGDGPLRSELMGVSEDLGVMNRVEFTGSTKDVRPHLQWADVLVLTSRTEGLPGVVLEAAAAGVPSVAVDVGGVAEAIEDGVTGLVVRRDPEAVAAALGSLVDDRDLLTRMGKEARRYVLDNYRMDGAADRYISILGGLIQ